MFDSDFIGSVIVPLGVMAALWIADSMRRQWVAWRYRRRLARDGYMLVEELREWEAAFGDEPDEDDLRRRLMDFFQHVAWYLMLAAAAWLSHRDSRLAPWLFGAAVVLGVGYRIWRHANNPETSGPWWRLPDVEIPREAVFGAVLGAGLAVAAVAALLMALDRAM
ncbi:MAG: hypothetical protein IE933_14585 [Sphingomonadales bacterium]|nr:hypothetical protein [Sphingomonadales bacterium]MBD3775193.1 hypothetical protein [Paracoccaceae bacterium]